MDSGAFSTQFFLSDKASVAPHARRQSPAGIGLIGRHRCDRCSIHASGVHIVGEPHARKDQHAGEYQGDGVNDHAMSVLIVAFRAFVFREIRDRRVIWCGTRLRPMPSGRGPHSRPESYHTAIIVVGVVGTHDEIRRYRLRYLCITSSPPSFQVIRSRIETTRSPSVSCVVSCLPPLSQTWMRSR